MTIASKGAIDILRRLNATLQNRLTVLKNLRMLCINGYKADFYMQNSANLRFKMSDSAEFKNIENLFFTLTNSITGT